MSFAPHLANLRADLATISLARVAFGILAIYLSDVIRAVRWALLMPSANRPAARTLIPSQFIGFAAVALFGRVADLTRPYLVARRTETPVTLQIAVYSLERALDLAATAILFSVTLLFTPHNAPHHEAFSRAGILASAATVFLLAVAVLVRTAGDRVSAWIRSHLQRPSPKIATAVADRLLELQAGFATLRSAPQIAGALAAAYHAFFGVPAAAASLCGFITFAVNTLSVIPGGLLLARKSGLSLREAARPVTPSVNA